MAWIEKKSMMIILLFSAVVLLTSSTLRGRGAEPWLSASSISIGLRSAQTPSRLASETSAILTPTSALQALSDGASDTVFPAIVKGLVGDHKNVSIKIGVLSMEKRNNSTFWFEFDPTLPMTLTSERWLMPYAASTETKEQIPFYINKLQGCSSMFMPSGANLDHPSYKKAAHDYCDAFAAKHPPSEWKIWDELAPSIDHLKAGTFACYQCHDPTMISKTAHYPSIAIKDIVRNIPYVITLLDIDAQGGDFEILKSIGPALQRVETIKMECQDFTTIVTDGVGGSTDTGPILPPLYATQVPNSCSDAITYLQTMGFELVEQVVNNCACAEYNLVMKNNNPRIVVQS